MPIPTHYPPGRMRMSDNFESDMNWAMAMTSSSDAQAANAHAREMAKRAEAFRQANEWLQTQIEGLKSENARLMAQADVDACNDWKARAVAAEQRETDLRAQLGKSAGYIRELTKMISATQADLTNAIADKEDAKLALKRADIFNTGLANGLDAMVAEARACPSQEHHPLAVEVEINVNGVPDSMAAVARIVYADQNG